MDFWCYIKLWLIFLGDYVVLLMGVVFLKIVNFSFLMVVLDLI